MLQLSRLDNSSIVPKFFNMRPISSAMRQALKRVWEETVVKQAFWDGDDIPHGTRLALIRRGLIDRKDPHTGIYLTPAGRAAANPCLERGCCLERGHTMPHVWADPEDPGACVWWVT